MINNIPTPEWIETNSLNDAVDFANKTNEKLIIKPASGSQGSKGVFLIDEESDISKCFDVAKENSHDSKVILEKYYIGREFSVDGIVVGEKPVILSVSEKFNLGPEHNFTMSGFSMVKIEDADEELQKKLMSINEIGKQAAVAMGISNSFFSVDIVLTENGLMVLECGVLLDCKIDRLLYHAGIDVYDLFIKLVTRQKLEVENIRPVENWSLSFLFAPNEGRLNINSEESNKYDGIIEWEKSNGSHVKPPDSIADTLGWIITKDKMRFDYKQKSLFIIE
ncbi:ATP-grasp domain-containing protein [candidate division KSB1 bacterium]|nr:ATP-grasp domain-containing protein [candidate division KSB1 bacterium]